MRISDWSSDVCSSDLLKDREGRYLLANRRVQEWLGKSQEEILGRTTSDLFDEDLAEQAETDDEVVVSSGVVVTREWNLTFTDGVQHSLLTTKFPVHITKGMPICILAKWADITASREDE